MPLDHKIKGKKYRVQKRQKNAELLEVQDIDSEVDWKLAELKYKLLHTDIYKG